MYQGKSHTLALTPAQDVAARLQALQQALIDQRVPGGHALFLQASGYPDLPIGRWGEEQCGPDDVRLATAVRITG